MNFFVGLFSYLFLAGILAGLSINESYKSCGPVTSNEARDILHISVLWPALFGTILTTTKGSIVVSECSRSPSPLNKNTGE